jgi:hypothetical protein
MTSTQRNSWMVLLADGAVFVWFWQKMTYGLSPVPVTNNMDEFGRIVIGIIILTIALHIAISIVFEVTSNSKDRGKDERDIAIERRGAFWGYRILQVGLGVVVVGMLMNGAFGGDYQAPITFSNPVEIIFGLIVTSYVADLVKHAVMIHGYGRWTGA